ncbi:MAG: LPS assembly protein LptD [Candidatus Hydrogenedentes bacterium]|nr:LPS assembly protein LptD [Candidatus Hydrogenedentota bacterium]
MTSILLALCPAFAQSPWVPITPGGVYRDAVLDPRPADGPENRVLLADYARSRVIQVDPATGGSTEALALSMTGSVPRPTALLTNQGGLTPFVACVGGQHSAVSGEEMPCFLHVQQYPAPGVAAHTSLVNSKTLLSAVMTGDNSLLLADPFGDCILRINPLGDLAGNPETLLQGAGRPFRVAVTDNGSEANWVAWVGLSSNALTTMNLSDKNGRLTACALPGKPLALVWLAGEVFAVATPSGILLCRAGGIEPCAEKALPVTDMAKDGEGLVVLSGGDVVMLDGELNETGRVPLEMPARLIRACGPVLVAMAPQEGQQRAVVWNRKPQAAAETAPAESGPEAVEPPEAVASENGVEIVEAAAAAPSPEPAPAPGEQVPETAPVAAPPAQEPEAPESPAAVPAPEVGVPAEEAAPAEETAAAPAAPAEKPQGRYRSFPMFTSSLRAPSLNTATHKLIGGGEQKGLRDALTRPMEFGEPGLGFTPPDWTEPLRDLEADSMTTDLTTGKTVMRDNVRLRLGEMAFRSDQFSYSDEQGSYSAEGHVEVSQHASSLTADYLSYATPDAAVVERSFVLEPRDEQNMAKKRLSMGRITGRNFHMNEPTRELLVEEVDYDFAAQKGTLTNARGRAAYFYYSAEKLHILGPEEFIAENAWFTTCPGDPPGYRIMVKELHVEKGEVVTGKGARLALGNVKAPFLLPIWGSTAGPYPWSVDFDSGRYAETGYYLNLGQQFQVSKELSLGPRIMPTEKEGVGLGGDIYYDHMETPSSRLYRTAGEFHGLQTTENRGYLAWYNRFEPNRDLVLRMQAEQWSDEEFFKDFFYEQYRHRSDPRTFANLTLRKEEFIATGTARINTHSWAGETERLPEATFHLVERPLVDRLMFSFDTVNGYNDRNPGREYGTRSVNIARMSYDWDPASWLSVTPFYELEGAWYQRERTSEDSATRVSNLAGVTLQTRLHREFPGFWGFSAFKHVILPSVTYSYRPEPTLAAEDAPRFDALDNVYGRSRLETKLTNVIYGRDAETNDVWQAARLTLYQGNDFWNETRKADDYEAELDLRPRPWWGMQLAGERHDTRRPESLLEENYLESRFYKAYERATGKVLNERAADLNLRYADYSRILTQLYYDNTVVGGRFNTRIGFAYSDTDGNIYNRDVLYGLGYRLSENWGVSFEHIYDLNGDEMRSQTYEIRRSFKCWETALRFRDRQSGFDVNMEISLTAFPDTAIEF